MAKNRMTIHTGHRRALTPLILAFLAGIFCTILLNSGMGYTNSLEFCTSCHSMSFNMEEYKKSIHYKNPSGVRAECPDCHVPKAFGPMLMAKAMAAKDVVYELLGGIKTKGQFEQQRWEMANHVWDKMQATDSRTCRSCHALAQMDLAGQEKIARKRHTSAEQEGKTCIDCHKGIAHEEPEEPDEATEETTQ